MSDAVKNYLNYWRYALNTNHTANRSEYLFPTLAHLCVFTLLVMADKENFDINPDEHLIATPLNQLYTGLTVLTIIPSYTLFTRRLNKLGRNKHIATASYAVNSLGLLWITQMTRLSQNEMNKRIHSKYFIALFSLLMIAAITEATISMKKDDEQSN
ncbi:hypothetical protein [Macrococcoides caseolyticum]|uniref:hypothetical protein n=1 Tax=Macrococcoides caseolyticum TaxID=69966 RepID=UPI001F264BB7|nr:hypothetical protein [Macrococcus caseolyticus]MCE4955990.1 hypothetical protein [Macrococcus caseolyticus]